MYAYTRNFRPLPKVSLYTRLYVCICIYTQVGTLLKGLRQYLITYELYYIVLRTTTREVLPIEKLSVHFKQCLKVILYVWSEYNRSIVLQNRLTLFFILFYIIMFLAMNQSKNRVNFLMLVIIIYNFLEKFTS